MIVLLIYYTDCQCSITIYYITSILYPESLYLISILRLRFISMWFIHRYRRGPTPLYMVHILRMGFIYYQLLFPVK